MKTLEGPTKKYVLPLIKSVIFYSLEIISYEHNIEILKP